MTTYNYVCITKDCISGLIPIQLLDEEKDDIMQCTQCECELKRVGQAAFSIGLDKKTSYSRNMKHFKKRAKDHGKSPEARKSRQHVLRRELGIDKNK